MRIWPRMGGLTATLLLAGCWSFAQTGSTSASGAMMLISAPPTALAAQGEVLREIDDPHTGDCWLLMLDPAHPGGPGRLLLASAGRKALQGQVRPIVGLVQALPVIRPGERVALEEHSAVADAHMEAVAMGPARNGDSFNVRLKIGGQILKAVALGPGHAVVQEATR